LIRSSERVYLRFADPSATYELKWQAHASNVVKPTSGVLRVLPREEPRRKAVAEGKMTAEGLFKAIGASDSGTEEKPE